MCHVVYFTFTVSTLEATTTVCNSNIQPTNTPQCGRTNTTVGSSSIQPTSTLYGDGATTTIISSNIQPTNTIYNDGATTAIISSIQATNTLYDDGVTTAIVSSIQATNALYDDGVTTAIVSSIQPTNTLYGDGATTLPVIIVVSVVIIILIIIVGVVILVVLFKKKKKQKLESNQLQNVTAEIELKLKQEGTNKKENSSEEYQNQNSTFIGGYSEINVIPADSEHSLPADPSRLVTLSTPMFKEMAPNPTYESIDRCHDRPRSSNVQQESACESLEINLRNITKRKEDQLSTTEKEASSTTDQPLYAMVQKEMPPSVPSKSAELVEYLESEDKSDDTTMVPQGATSDVISTTPDSASSQTVKTDNGEAVYSEPIHPSLFTDAVESASDSQNSLPYTSIYTIPTPLTKSEEMPLKVFGDNIREIHELGIGVFGKVILAETVGLSPKDLKMSKTDDEKSKSMLVAVKTLKPGAPSTTKEAFEKEVNFMSRLNDRNVIRILGVCREDTPFIMMEYMEKGDLNNYLQKFKVLSTIDSEPQGKITTTTLVHITTQIASAMKYLASHNFVHRDLATRNCLVGPNYLVKISDFGMSRSLYESHYYCIQGHAVLPVRWMSMECFYGKFSQKSDVWAFGVTTWEIFTLAKEQPYNDMSDKQVIENAIKGKSKERRLLTKPEMCPPEVYEIMLKCWAHNTKKRPTFEEIFQLLDSIHSV